MHFTLSNLIKTSIEKNNNEWDENLIVHCAASESDGNDRTSKINVFPMLNTRFFSTRGAENGFVLKPYPTRDCDHGCSSGCPSSQIVTVAAAVYAQQTLSDCSSCIVIGCDCLRNSEYRQSAILAAP